MTYPDEEYHSGAPITAIVIAVVAVVLIGAVGLGTCSSNATEQARSANAAQIAAERERTARAELRAENTAQVVDLFASALAPLVFVVCAILALAAGLIGGNWFADNQTQRMIVRLEAMRRTELMLPQPQAPLRLEQSRPNVSRETFGRE